MLAHFSRGQDALVNPLSMVSDAQSTKLSKRVLQRPRFGNPGYAGSVAQMVYGPASPPLGVGSAQLATAPSHGDASASITTSSFDGTPLSSLTSLSYSTYDTVNNGQPFPYLALSVSLNGTPTGPQDVLFFEPPYQSPATGNPSLPNQGAPVMNTWQTWNALEGGWWDNNGNFNPGTTEGSTPGVNSLTAFLLLYPNATLIDIRTGPAEFAGLVL